MNSKRIDKSQRRQIKAVRKFNRELLSKETHSLKEESVMAYNYAQAERRVVQAAK